MSCVQRRASVQHKSTQPNTPGDLCRRNFLQLLSLGTVGLGFGVSIFTRGYAMAEETDKEMAHQLLMQGTKDFKGVRISEITPNDMFYQTAYAGVADLSLDTWQLRIEGLVDKPMTLKQDDRMKLMDKTEAVTLSCIGNRVGGDSIGNAVWEGVTLKKVLEHAGPKSGIRKVVFSGGEGYTDSIPFDLAMDGTVFLAYRMNGVPLPREHGFPLRAVVPGIYGMKNVKWLQKVELVDHDYKGYWEAKGWSDTAEILTLSQILMPMTGQEMEAGTHVIGGFAYAGRRGVAKVELSLDGGKTWNPVELKPPLSKFAWVIWRYEWKANEKGNFSLQVRATDKKGKVQESGSLLGRSYPDGAKGIHEIKISIT